MLFMAHLKKGFNSGIFLMHVKLGQTHLSGKKKKSSQTRSVFQNVFISHIQNKVSCISTNIQYIHQ